MRILTFNWHEPYICLLAATGHHFDVAPPLEYPERTWDLRSRPIPSNVSEVAYPETADAYDLVVCLTLQDVRAVHSWHVPRLYVMLNMIGTDAAVEGVEKDAFVEGLRPLFDDVSIAFISEKKRQAWGWPAPVVVSGIDPDDYGPYWGRVNKVLRVGNGLVERDHMQGYGIQERILDGMPSTVVGLNPTIPGARPASDWHELRSMYSTHRVMLSTLTDEHEDGYNLAVLEAMASGAPVVCLANSSTPIIDGVNGYVSDDLQYLRRRLLQLLEDQGQAAKLGARGRETVRSHFHIDTCVAGWRRVFADCIGGP